MQEKMQPFAVTAGGQTTCLRSLKRKHPNGNIDNGWKLSMPSRIFHADAFCGICRKVQIFKKKNY